MLFQPIREGGSGEYDLWMSRRSSSEGAFGQPVNLGPLINTPGRDTVPSLTADGLTLLFSSQRDPDMDLPRMMVSRRDSVSDSFGPASVFEVPRILQGSRWAQGGGVSGDAKTLFFQTENNRYWISQRVPADTAR